MQIPNLTRKSKLPQIDSSDILPLAFLGLSVGVLILAISLFWLAVSFSRLANQKTPTLVQQVDGRAFTVRSADYYYREPELIRRFVSDWAVMTFTWGKLPGDQRQTIDKGIEVAGNKRVSTAAWEASFALAPDFRDAFLQQMATDVVPEGVFDGKVSAILVPQQISPPQSAGEERWQVDLIATRILFDDTNPAGYTVPFNRRFFVRAIEPPHQPLIQNAADYQRVVYRMLEGGVQIEEIRPINPEELSQ